MNAFTEIICPCTTRQARYKKYTGSPDALTPPSGSYSWTWTWPEPERCLRPSWAMFVARHASSDMGTYSPSLSLGTGISAHWILTENHMWSLLGHMINTKTVEITQRHKAERQSVEVKCSSFSWQTIIGKLTIYMYCQTFTCKISIYSHICHDSSAKFILKKKKKSNEIICSKSVRT
jgi:hypothetical protein